MNQEEQIIVRCQQGDRQAMGQLYTAMHDELLNVCRRYVNDDNTAEDLLHDAFLLIFSKIGEIRSPRKARGWMRRVVKNVALLYAEQQDRMHTVSLDSSVTYAALNAQSDFPLTYDELLNIIDSLPEGYRRVFSLSVLEGLSHQEIAALLNIEPHTSSSQLNRAKTLLRNSLAVLLMSLLMVVGYRLFNRNDVESDKPTLAESDKQGKEDNNNSKLLEEQPLVGTYSCICPQTQACDRHVQTPDGLIQEAEEQVQKPEEQIQEAGGEVQKSEEAGGQIQEYVPPRETSPAIEMKVPSSHSSHFDLALAYSGLPSHNSQSLPIGIDGTNGPIDSTAHHRMPLTIALDLSRQINERWSLNAGLHYTMLSSDFQNGNTLSHIDRSQTVRYLGFSLGTTYQLWPAVVGNASERYSQRRNAWKRCPLRLYVSASVAFDLPLRSTSETTYIQNGLQIGSENLRLHPSTQWSLGLGLGLQYSITPGVGFFVEPSLRYYFPNDDDIETWRTEHPFAFDLPLGLRITF